MPNKIERLLFLRKKLGLDLKRLHAKIQTYTKENDTGTLVSYQNALEDCWSKYESNNDTIENSKDNPSNEDYITERSILNDLYMEAQGKLLQITPNNTLHESLALFKPKNTVKKRVLPKRKLSNIEKECPTHSSNLSESNKNNHNNKSMLFKALPNQGSIANMITKHVSDTLQLPLHQVNVPITGVGGSVTCRVRKRTKFVLQPHFEAGESLQLDALVMPKITTLNLVSQDKNWKHFENNQLADPHWDKNGRIDTLIGPETFSEILLNGVMRGECLQPIAKNTKFGLTLSGQIDSGNTPIIPIMSIFAKNVHSTKRAG